ncbi:NAD(P)H-dependent oxidoreductase [Polaribacter staleyi]|uniref:NAD(P)H-dependent oxidoreductase n=1 Tax=Polaribacter staleyi TaxID=2022337 RepID=UPI0031BA3FE6
MKHLIIYAHPNEKSLNSYFKQIVEETLTNQHQEIIIRDLNLLNFNPILTLSDIEGQRIGKVKNDVKQEQDFISWSDHITLIYPIWWTGMPAILKGYIDRVFSYGFAYCYDQGVQKGLLTNKQITIINTQGKSQTAYKESGMDKALLQTSDEGIFRYCGLKINHHFFFDKADSPTKVNINNWIKQIRSVYKY